MCVCACVCEADAYLNVLSTFEQLNIFSFSSSISSCSKHLNIFKTLGDVWHMSVVLIIRLAIPSNIQAKW